MLTCLDPREHFELMQPDPTEMHLKSLTLPTEHKGLADRDRKCQTFTHEELVKVSHLELYAPENSKGVREDVIDPVQVGRKKL